MARKPPSDPGRIVGISRSSLWGAWKQVRRAIRHGTVRDVADYLEYDIDPNVWIDRLLAQIKEGTYEPRIPSRFLVAKSKGFSRRMTMPAIPDLVLYRAIADFALGRLRRREHKHVYFERGALKKATEAAQAEAEVEKKPPLKGLWGQILRQSVDYETGSKRRFRAWLHYSQYRRFLIFKKVHPWIVTTDITNFFDSVLHDRLAECFHTVALPPRMIGLLFFLLERLSVREPYSESRSIGLPVDEYDCSRQLAHLVLFSHDDRMVSAFGEGAYVRWMDDQNLGVDSKSLGLRALALVGDSLGRLNLTANAGKSRVLSITEAKRHFHLDINDALDKLEAMPFKKVKDRQALARAVGKIWRDVRQHDGKGEWDKILKRVYRFAGLGRARLFRKRALSDVLAHPHLTDRIADYMRASGSPQDYLEFAHQIWSHPEQLYGDVNLRVVERLLLVEPSGSIRRSLRKIAVDILSAKWALPGADLCAGAAALLLLRCGDRRSLPLLRRCFDCEPDGANRAVIRACGMVYASYGIPEFRTVRKAAAAMLANPLSDMVRLIERIRSYEEVPGSYKQRVRVDVDAVVGRAYLDMRSVLAARLLTLNTKPTVKQWCDQKKTEMQKRSLSSYDRAMIRRLL